MSFDIYLILDSLPKMLSGIGLTFQLMVRIIKEKRIQCHNGLDHVGIF